MRGFEVVERTVANLGRTMSGCEGLDLLVGDDMFFGWLVDSFAG